MHLPLPGLKGTCGLAQVAVFVLLLSGAHSATPTSSPTQASTPAPAITTTTKATSTTTTATTSPAPSDPVVHNVTAVDGQTLKVQWSAAVGSTETSYKVTYKRSDGTGTTRDATCSVAFECDIDVSNAQTLPGERFDVTVKAVKGGVSSAGATQTGNTKPLAPGVPVFEERTTSTLRLTGTPPTAGTTIFDKYAVEVDPEPTETPSISHTDNSYEVNLRGLVSGKQYTVYVRTVSGAEKSDAISNIFYTVPPTPGAVSRLSTGTTSTELWVTWAAPTEGEFEKYIVTLTTPGNDVPITRQEFAKNSTREATFTGLTPGTRYSVIVRTLVSSNVYSDNSATELNIKPAIPENLNIESRTSISLTVKWDPPTIGTFDRFIAKLQERSTEQNVNKNDKGEHGATFDRLQPGKEYIVEVMAVSGDQQGQSLTNSFFTKPQRPTNLKFDTATSSSISVKWDAITIGSHDGYTITIKHSANPEVLQNLDKSATSYTFEGLLPAEKYTVNLSSRLEDIESDKIYADYYTNPKPPIDVQVSQTNSDASFNWSPPDQAASVDSYKYVITKSGSSSLFIERVVQTTRSATHQLPTPGTTFTVDVYAIKNNQTGEASSVTFNMVPNNPRDLTKGDIGGKYIEVTWKEPLGEYDGFKVTWKVDGLPDTLQEVTKARSDRIHQITGLLTSTTYKIVVFATAGDERSSGATIIVKTDPDAIELVVSRYGTNYISVSWEKPATGNVKLTIVPYPQGMSGEVDVQENDPSSYTWNNLIPGKGYILSIEVISGSQSSGKRERAVRTKPMAVMNLSAETLSTSSMRIQWTINQSSLQDQFTITYGVNGSGNPEDETIHATTGLLEYTYEIIGLQSGFTYVIVVVAKKRSEQSDSKEIPETTSASREISKTTKPLPVRSLQADVSNSTKVTLTWQPSLKSEQNAYRYQYTGTYKTTTMAPLKEVSETSVAIDGLFPGDTYRFEVQAVSNDQTSSLEDVTVTTNPLPPINLHVNTERTKPSEVEVEWTDDKSRSFITGWKIYTSHADNTSLQLVGSNDDHRDVRETIRGLVSGKNYTVHVKGVSGETESTTATTVIATAKPVIRFSTREIVEETTEDTITFDYTQSLDGEFDHYRFTLNDTSVDPVIKKKSDEDRKVKFTGLTAGAKYRIEARTVSGSEESNPAIMSFDTKPNPPEMECGESGKNYITLIFKAPSGFVDSYYWACKSEICPPDFQTPMKHTAHSGIESKRVTGLASYKEYSFDVYSRRHGKHSRTVNMNCQTAEGPPSPVKDFKYGDLKPYEVTLTWTVPDERNGIITAYEISYSGTKERKDLHKDGPFVHRATPPLEYRVEGLKAGYNYTFKIQAKTKELGAIATLSVILPITSPGLLTPENNYRPTAKRTEKPSHKQFDITLFNPFNNKNGDVTEFSILVTTDANVKINGINNLNSWAEVQGQKPRPPYFAVKLCHDLFERNSQCWTSARRRKRATDPGARVDFTVGGDDSCRRSDPNTYCNGPLDPDTPYYVAVVGYTENGDYTVGPYSEAIVTGVAPASSSIVPVIVGIIAALLVILVVVIIVVFLMRTGRICKNGTPQAVPLQPTGLHHDPEPRVKESNPVKVKDFPDHVAKMTADSDFRFAEEYEELKYVGKNEPAVAAEIACNRLKNRFTNILPYDHSRVKMLPTDDEEGSDYINANWIPGYHSRREFIATQGPLPSTRDDFWRMIWEYNTRAIIMLTKCVEKGRQRCDHYWPVDSEPMFYGDLQVMILHETKCPDWVVSEFKISKGEQSRRLKHFHYLAWPDMDVPDKPQSLVAFVRLIRSKLKPEGGPIVVHCSAGVGRSGTFIALDHILAHIREHDYVDAYNVVYEMRRNRNIMVQTERQYIFLHRCILCVIENREDDNDMVGAGGMENTAFEDDEGIDVKTDS